MKLILGATLFAAMTSAASAATPMAADAMSPNAMAGVPAAAMKKITHCKTMAHDAMMSNKTCMKMMKLYPTAFSGSASSN